MSLRDAIRDAEAILPGTPAPEGADDPRWQAIMDIEEHVEANPEAIWPFVARWGCHEQEDLRTIIATCLLEDLLEHHFALIFPRVRELATADGRFADTFLACWKLGQATLPENAESFDGLAARCASRKTA